MSKIPKAKTVGIVFEGAAEKMLIEKGYKILERNFVSEIYETDIIAKKQSEICFVEVKSRKENSLLSPQSAVASAKMNNILRSAAGYVKYLNSKGIDIEKFSYSFDVIGIIYNKDYELLSIEHFKNYYKGEKEEFLKFSLE